MNVRYLKPIALLMMLGFLASSVCFSQSKGLKTITEQEMRYHLDFLGAKEFRGRETPSPELEIATVYLGNWAKYNNLKPVMADGSFYQSVPLLVTSVFQPGTRIKISNGNREQTYWSGKAFSGNFRRSGSYSGQVVFAGLGISDPQNGWDDLKDVDVRGKIVIILDAQLPGTTFPLGYTITERLTTRMNDLRNRGAAAVLSVVDMEREQLRAQGENIFDYIPTGVLDIMYDTRRTNFSTAQTNPGPAKMEPRPSLPFERAEICHDLASDILEISKEEIAQMFRMTEQGLQVPSKMVSGLGVTLDVQVESFKSTSRNVIAMVEGSDPVLKNEYVVVSSHHDARGIDEGRIIAGADDNGTAVVALMEIAQALMVERPKRSVILAWFTGEEQSMNGSHYFVNNCPVPIEKISVCLNMDMLGRNSPDSLYLVGSDLLSSELDGAIKHVNKKAGINFEFDYKYSNFTHPQQVYFRSDQYPFIRYGIPSVWIFCGFTHDYHTHRDLPEFIDHTKLLRSTQLVYLSAFQIANMKDLVKLDVNPAVTLRGKHNLRERSLFQYLGK